MKSRRPLIVLMPVHEDRESASVLIAALAKILHEPPYIVAVDDGSIDKPFDVSAIENAGLAGEVLFLARNMGHQRAIAAGLVYIRDTFNADVVVVMDSDGEDRPEAVPGLIEELRKTAADAVVAERRKRFEPLGFRIFYSVYRLLFWMLTGRAIHFGNFAALSARAINRLAAMQEIWVHFAGSLLVSKLRIRPSPTDRGNRYFGRSQMTFVSLSLHGMRSVMVFADDVLVRVGIFCAAVMAGALLLFIGLTAFKLAGLSIPGWFSISSGILFVIVLQAGVLAFVTLMISGVARDVVPITPSQLLSLIDRVEKASPPNEGHANPGARSSAPVRFS